MRGFTHKEKLEKENSWYCNRCKEFKEATKQMEIYKTNKILVMAFKRFSRHSKITLPIKFPIEGLDIGPFVLCTLFAMQPTATSSPCFMTCMEW